MRRDSALVYRGESPDYKHILREACKSIRRDVAQWGFSDRLRKVPAEASSQKVTAAETASNRYDPREVRNGSIATTAIFDKQTGQVWVWTELTEKNGKKTGRSAFVAEDVLSTSISPKPIQ